MSKLWLAILLAAAELVAPDMAPVPGGTFTPLYRPETTIESVRIPSFLLDRVPVTHGDFLKFVLANPRWSRNRAPSVFRDTHYLREWVTDVSIPTGAERRPATQVSWFAARAYCAAQGKRLPTAMEWEYAASAGSGGDPAARDEVLRWYAMPHEGPLAEVASGPSNALGLHDFHRLWEWVEDFNASLLSGDNRSDADKDRNLYCGGASSEAVDKADYAAFMRYAFRSSLKASYGTHNLGFRCAKDE
ncbi:MAG: formylglycine-generating enzyme family protein [Nitrospirae bacterium]|nr:formylglycine-generating enzyme family protein [Nitrospirota bacterium]